MLKMVHVYACMAKCYYLNVTFKDYHYYYYYTIDL